MKKMLHQVKALTRKNFIIWKRTLMSSLFEIIFPALLITLLVGLRHWIPAKRVPKSSLKRLMHPLFPVETGNVTTEMDFILSAAVQQAQLNTFANYSGYNATREMPSFDKIDTA